jgi:hypothetical protein
MVSRLRVGTTDADIIADEHASLVHKSFGHSTGTIQSTEIKITASDAYTQDYLGYERTVAIGSGCVVVGALYEDINGTNSGAAYIFDLDGNEIAKIDASDGASNDQFGRSVAAGSGRILVGAPYNDDDGSASGEVYFYNQDGQQVLSRRASDAAAGDIFGYSVAIGCNRAVVGAPGNDDNGSNSGSAYIFDLDGNEITKITASDAALDDQFGFICAIGNGRIVVGAPYNDDGSTNAGSAYIFDLEGNQIAKITAPDATTSNASLGVQFGRDVAVGSGRIVVGAPFENTSSSILAGSAYIFDLEGNQIAKITASDGIAYDYFGYAVGVGSGKIVVGAYNDDDNGSNSGSAYIFDLDGTQIAKIDASDGASNDNYGRAVAIGSGRVVASAWRADVGFAADAGAAYIYKLPQNYDIHFERTLGY